MDVQRREVASVGRNGADERIVPWHLAGRMAADPVAVLRDVSAPVAGLTEVAGPRPLPATSGVTGG